jgi:hypothetical protein
VLQPTGEPLIAYAVKQQYAQYSYGS